MLTTTSTLKEKEKEKRPLTPEPEEERVRTVVIISMPFEVQAKKRWSTRTAVEGAEPELPHMELGVIELPARGLGATLEEAEAEERALREAEEERTRAALAPPQPSPLYLVRSRAAEFISSRVHLPVLTEVASRGGS